MTEEHGGPGAPAGRGATFVREGTAFLFFAACAAAVTWPLAARLTTHTLRGPDPLSHLWVLNWLTGHFVRPAELFHGNIFHPAPYAVMFTDLSMGTAVLVWPLRLFVSEPLVLFNVGTLLALAFGGWAFQRLAFVLTGHRPAAILAGLLAAFNPHQMCHVYHLNLLSCGWLALFLLGLHRLVQRPGPGAAVLTGVSFALNAQSSGYYGVASVVLALVFAAFHTRRLLTRRAAAMVALSVAVGVLLLLPFLLHFRALRAEEGMRRPPGLSRKMAFQPARDLTSCGHLYSRVMGGEGELLFPGVLPLVLAALALVRRRPGAPFPAAAATVLIVLSLGPELQLGDVRIPLPYAWVFAVPPFDAMRHPYTFAAVAAFLLAVLAAIGMAGLARTGWTRGAAVFLALAAAEIASPRPMLVPVPAGVPPVYELLATRAPGPVLEVPVFEDWTVVWAARHGRPTVNGIGAFVPARTMVLERYVRNHWMARVPDDLDTSRPTPYLVGRFPVRYVIVPAGRRPELRALAGAFDRSRTFDFVAEAHDGDRLYEVRRD